jgi:hypothetical protein
MKKLLGILCLSFLLAGCIPTAIATYSIVRTKNYSQYREYVADMEKVNQERKDKGLEPMEIKPFDKWKKGE